MSSSVPGVAAARQAPEPTAADGAGCDCVTGTPPGGAGHRSADREQEERPEPDEGVAQRRDETVVHATPHSVGSGPVEPTLALPGMPETPEELYARVAEALRMPPVETWETFPFEGDLRPRALLPPVACEEPRRGEGGVDCRRCGAPDTEFVWVSERWRLQSLPEPSGLPVVLLLEPRAHYGEPGDLPDGLASELGLMIARVERAIRSIGGIGRVHVCRWGDGGEHLHWWFMARPARLPQLIGSFTAIWDDILPPLPEAVWRANIAAVVEALERDR